MDQFMVNLAQGEAYVGDEVVAIGKQGSEQITVHDIAEHIQSIPYEVLTNLNIRLPRLFKK